MYIGDMRAAQRILAGTFDRETADDGTYAYDAFAEPGTATDTGTWAVRRVHKENGQTRWKSEGRFIHKATDLPGLFI